MCSNKKGFTLIELMIGVVVFMVIIAALFASLTAGRKVWFSGTTTIELQWELRKAKNSLIEDLSQARTGSTFSMPSGGSLNPGTNALQLSIPLTLDNISDDLIPASDWSAITYFLDGTNSTYPGSPTVFQSSITMRPRTMVITGSPFNRIPQM